ncbi:phosphoenolpyruvate carboxykinase (GTP), partial [bacterium]|nr:phosphoenolpyruvate carboxykinase (GTP) [bacterium]
FLSIPIGKYIQDNLNIGRDLNNPPLIFSVNYFLKGKEGKFLNEKNDKKIWYKWMELRVHTDVPAIESPTGRMPMYEDLKRLFQEILGEEYRQEDYDRQFTVRVPENLAKIERIKKIYQTQVSDTPKILFEILEKQKLRLEKTREQFGDYVLPEKLLS